MTAPDNTRHQQPAAAEPAGDPLVQLADNLEMSFNDIQQTLTDPGTAAAFLRTLDIVQRALEGSHAHQVITSEQLEELVTVIEGMRQAPRLV